MSNKTYDILRFISQIILPAIGTLYLSLADIWGMPFGQQVVGTCLALTTFFGVALKISSNQYNKDQEKPKVP